MTLRQSIVVAPFLLSSAFASTRIAGRYGTGPHAIDLVEENRKLFMLPVSGGHRLALRVFGDHLIAESPLFDHAIRLTPGAIVLNGRVLKLLPERKPSEPSKSLKGLLGEYGPDANTLYVLEEDNRLTSMMEASGYEPLRQISSNIFRGIQDGKTLLFERDALGKGTLVRIGATTYQRRPLGPADGKIFRITPLRPIEELRREALAQQPPPETGPFKKPDLVELTSLDSTIKLDIRYATTHNFLSTPMYTQARAFMQRPAAEAVARANRALHQQGYGLLIHDAYRPWYVTKMFWDATPDDKKIFVADPSHGSRHNRGCAVDLTLYDLATGKAVEMVGVYDEMSARSYPFYPGGTERQRWFRTLLRRAMEDQEFTVYETEWWHFDYNAWQEYPILNEPFESLQPTSNQ